MTLCVLDASLAIELAFPGADRSGMHNLIEQLHARGVVVPDIWHWEVVNVALKHERRLRSPADHTDTAIESICSLVAETELSAAEEATSRLREIARTEHITLFDAAYIDLAERTRLPLATLDGGLAAAALRRGIALLPLTP